MPATMHQFLPMCLLWRWALISSTAYTVCCLLPRRLSFFFFLFFCSLRATMHRLFPILLSWLWAHRCIFGHSITFACALVLCLLLRRFLFCFFCSQLASRQRYWKPNVAVKKSSLEAMRHCPDKNGFREVAVMVRQHPA